MNNSHPSPIYRPHLLLAVILIGYLIAATLFATMTPRWQMPDEPAHYNYIAHIARGDGLPILEMGDFDMGYIGQVVSERFPPELSVEPLRYEFYQPPLYYLTAVPVYWMAGGMRDLSDPTNYGHALTSIRLLGVFLGFISLLLLNHCLAVAFPGKPTVRLCATAFAATLPMHVAMTAAVNNDSLAILLLLAASLVLLRWMRAALVDDQQGVNPPQNATTPEDGTSSDAALQSRGTLLFLGLLLGFGLMTKIYAYIYLPVCVATVGLISWRRVNFRQALLNAGWILLPALLLGMSLWIRNMALYGILDPLGLTWHDAVVVGQATTTDWIAQNGWSAYWERAIGFTFRSFWGVFGWLGLFWDWRLYTAVRVLTITIGAGLVGLIFSVFVNSRLMNSRKRVNESQADEADQLFHRWVAFLFVVTAAAVMSGYVFYNLKFVQHQGRYFFWGILPISTFFALGWRQLMRSGTATGKPQGATLWTTPWTTLWAMVLLVCFVLYALLFGDRNPWTLLIFTAMVGILLLRVLLWLMTVLRDNEEAANQRPQWVAWVPRSVRAGLTTPALSKGAAVIEPLLWAAPFLFLFTLCIISVFSYVVPQLGQ